MRTVVGYALQRDEINSNGALKEVWSITYTKRVLPSLLTTDVVTVPALFVLAGLAIVAKSISVFEKVVVRVLLALWFTTSTTVSAVYVAVMTIWNQAI